MWEPLTFHQCEIADDIVEDYLYAIEAVRAAHFARLIPKESYESIAGWLAESTVVRLGDAGINIHAYHTSEAETVARWVESLDADDSAEEAAKLAREERKKIRQQIRDDAKTKYKPRGKK